MTISVIWAENNSSTTVVEMGQKYSEPLGFTPNFCRYLPRFIDTIRGYVVLHQVTTRKGLGGVKGGIRIHISVLMIII